MMGADIHCIVLHMRYSMEYDDIQSLCSYSYLRGVR